MKHRVQSKVLNLIGARWVAWCRCAGFLLLASLSQAWAQGDVQFSLNQYVIDENGVMAVITVMRPSASGDATVDYTITDGTAINGIDYNATANGTLTFYDGETEQLILIEIVDNGISDGNRMLTLDLQNAIGVNLGDPIHATLTIMDNEAPPRAAGAFHFTSTNYVTSEGDPRVRVTVTRNGAADGAVYVGYTITDDTALAGIDYLYPDFYDPYDALGVLFFDDFEMSQDIWIPLQPNTDTNVPPLNFSISLVAAQLDPIWWEPELVPTIAPSNHTAIITMLDNATGFNFDVMYIRRNVNHPGYSPSVTVTLRVNLPDPHNDGCTVDYDTLQSDSFQLTAGSDYSRAGVDYTATSGTLTFNKNDYSRTFDVVLLGWTNFGFNKDTLVGLSNPRGKAKGGVGGTNDVDVRLGRVTRTWITAVHVGWIGVRSTNQGGWTTTANPQVAGAVDLKWTPDYVSWTIPPNYVTPGANDTVCAVVVQPDDRVLVGGNFTTLTAHPWNHLGRLFPDGQSDTNFAIGTGPNGFVQAIALYTNGPHSGKIIIGGGFTSFNGSKRYRVARLNSDGSLDTSFDPLQGTDGSVRAVAIQPDGKVIIGGDFTTVGGLRRLHIARLNEDGTVDSGFSPGTLGNPGTDDNVRAVAVMGSAYSNAVVLGGEFTTVGGVERKRIARLNADGSVDASFDPGSGMDGPVYSIAVQPDQNIIIGGNFSMINLYSRKGIARLSGDGSLDRSFDPGTGMNRTVSGVRVLPDGKILAVGEFSSYNDTRRVGVVRIHPFGTIDTSFMDTAYNQYAGIMDRTNRVWTVDVQSTGDVIIGGQFRRVGGGFTRLDWHPRYNLARLIGGATPGPGYVEFSLPEYRADEYAILLYALLMRRDGVLGGITITGTNTDGLATSPADYGLAIGQTTWQQHWNGWYMADGQVNTISNNPALIFAITDENLQEDNETFTIQLVPPFDTLVLGGDLIPLGVGLGRREAIGTILNDDFPKGEFVFSAPVFTVDEDAGAAIVTVSRVGGSDGQASVRYKTGPATNSPATPYYDFTPVSNGLLDFGPDETNKVIRITISNDRTVEPDENFAVILYNPSGAALGVQTNAVVTIIDNDYTGGRLSFTSSFYVENETAPYASITAQRRGGNVGQVSVQYATMEDTAVAGINYSNVTGILTWTDGDSADKSFQVPLINNSLVEGTRRLRLALSQFVGALPGSTTNANLSIEDDDAYGKLEFSASNYLVDENGGAVLVTVVRNGGIVGEIGVDYATVGLPPRPGTATGNVDYADTSGHLIFAPGQLSATFQVPILDDSASEGDEAVKLVLSNPAGGAELGSRNEALLTIIDNESMHIPAGSVDTLFEIGVGADGNVRSLAIQTDGDLVLGGDFTRVKESPRSHLARLRSNGTLDATFAAAPGGVNGSVRSLAVQSDGRILLGGQFTAVNGTNRNNIARVQTDGMIDIFFDPGAGADNMVNAVAIQRLGNVEKVLLGGNFSSLNGITLLSVGRLNTNGSVDTSFSVGSGANGPVHALAVQPDGKVIVGGDFTLFNGQNCYSVVRLNTNGSIDPTFNVGAGANGSVRAIVVQSDGRIVLGGTFTSFRGSTNACRLVRLEPNGALDNDYLAQIGISANAAVLSLALQVDGKLLVGGEFTRFNGITRSRLTRLNVDGTVDPTINFGAGANDYVSTILVQPDRNIVIGGAFTMYNDETNNHIARIHGGSLIGAGSLQLTSASYVANENQSNVVIELERKGGTTGMVSVDLSTIDGTAVGGIDFIGTNWSVVFPQAETRATVILPIVNDNLIENDETFDVVLSEPGNGAQLGARPQATITILSDDAEISFTSSNYTVMQNIPTHLATIGVNRIGNLKSTVTVGFRALPGTARAGEDFTLTNGTLTFLPDEATKTFDVEIINNPEITENLTVLLVLTNVVGQARLAAPTNAVLTIIENETSPGLVTLGASTFLVSESGTNLVVNVYRTNGHTGIVTVDYKTINGTASNYFDFLGGTNTLTFNDGEKRKTVVMTILPDFLVEGNETFDISLSNPTAGLQLGTISRATVTIEDDDFGPGSLDLTFNPGTGANQFVRSMAMLPDDRIMIVGAFTTYGSNTVGYITRVRTNGLMDMTFTNGSGANGMINSIALEANGNFVVGGAFTTYNGQSRKRVARVQGSGVLDANLTQDTMLNAAVYTALGLPDNKLLAGGAFTTPQAGVTRLQVNGAIDTSFNTGVGITNGSVWAMLMDGTKAVLAGSFTEMDHVPRTRVVRVNPNGTVDLQFVPPSITGGTVYSLALQTDGKLLVGGDFTNVNGVVRHRLIRLESNGALDTNFVPVTITNGIVYALAVQADGKILIGGSFTSVGGRTRNRIARLNSDGILDLVFDPGIGANNTVYTIGLQRDGQAVIGGSFTSVNGFARNGLARLNGDIATEPNILPGYAMLNGVFTITWESQVGRNYIVEASTNLVDWVSVHSVTALGPTTSYTDSSAMGYGCRFYRTRMVSP